MGGRSYITGAPPPPKKKRRPVQGLGSRVESYEVYMYMCVYTLGNLLRMYFFKHFSFIGIFEGLLNMLSADLLKIKT